MNDVPVVRSAHAWFAPVERTSSTPAWFDPATHGGFSADAPPPGWLSLGPVRNLLRTATTEVVAHRTGARGAAAAQFRRTLGARVEFDFTRWGKLQMAVSAGSQHFNVLEKDPLLEPIVPGGHVPAPARVLTGSDPSHLRMSDADLSRFRPGELVAVDEDFTGQTGYLGSGIAATYLDAPTVQDAHFLRRITFNVARIAALQDSALVLAQPLPGGYPPPGAGVARIVGFEDRESGSYFGEWSALFVLDGDLGGRLCFYYPRLQCAAPAAETSLPLCDEAFATLPRASFTALPVDDPIDGEPYVARRIYLPAPGTALY